MNLSEILLPYQRKFVENPKKRKIWISSRQVGKSFDLGYQLVKSALLKPNGLSLCISTGARAAAEIIRKCAQFAEAVKQLTSGKITYTQSFDSIKFNNGCRVVSLPSSDDGSNLRGWTANCVCLDEAAFIRHLDEQLNAIAPTLTRDPDAELIFTTTPAGTNGPFYELYQHALNDPDWYVQHTTIHDAINDGLKVDLDSLRSLCPDPDVFAQEYECKFSKEFSTFIDTTLLDFVDAVPQSQHHYLGMDIGSKSDRTAIVDLVEYKSELYVNDVIILKNTTYTEQMSRVEILNRTCNFKKGFVDSNGIGSGIAEFLNKKLPLIQGYTTTPANKTQNYEYLRMSIFDKKIHFLKKFKDLIICDFNNVSRVVTENGSVRYIADRNENGHSDITSAIVLGLQAYKTNPPSFTMPMSYSMKSRIF